MNSLQNCSNQILAWLKNYLGLSCQLILITITKVILASNAKNYKSQCQLTGENIVVMIW